MDFDLSKAQHALQRTVREFLDRECPIEKTRELMETETAFDKGLWNAIAEQGWMGIALAEDAGGLGLSLVEQSIVVEEMGRACLPGPFFSTLWSATLIAETPDAKQRQRFLDPILAGEASATVAFLEESVDWNPAAVALAGERAGDQVVLKGKKTFVTDAATVDHILCVARVAGEFAVVAVPKGAAGLKVTKHRSMDETRKLCDVAFEGVRAPASDVLAVGKAAEAAVRRANDVATLAVCAELVGLMQWMLETATEYAKTRKQFDKVIGSFQAVQHMCVDMLMYTENSRSATWHASWALSENDASAASSLAIAKAYCSDAGREVGNRCVQAHGGIGFTWEHNNHLYYKRAKADEFLLGDPSHHREAISKMIIG